LVPILSLAITLAIKINKCKDLGFGLTSKSIMLIRGLAIAMTTFAALGLILFSYMSFRYFTTTGQQGKIMPGAKNSFYNPEKARFARMAFYSLVGAYLGIFVIGMTILGIFFKDTPDKDNIRGFIVTLSIFSAVGLGVILTSVYIFYSIHQHYYWNDKTSTSVKKSPRRKSSAKKRRTGRPRSVLKK
jgi:hypothetical protein